MKTLATIGLLLFGSAAAWADHDENRLTIGIVGDSLSDEYNARSAGLFGQFLGYEGYEWGSILILRRKVTLGRFSDMFTPYGQPEGYEYNHALKGQGVLETNNIFEFFGLFPGIGDSGQSFADQAQNLAWNFANGEIDVGVIQGGSNDVSIYNLFATWEDLTAEPFVSYRQAILDAFAAILDTPVPGRATLADEKIVLSLIPTSGAPDQMAGIASINAGIQAVAAARGVPTYDPLSALGTHIDFSDPLNPLVRVDKVEFPLGSVASSSDLVEPGDKRSVDDDQCGFRNDVDPFTLAPGCPTPVYQMNLTQDDGIHPTTIFAGLIANAVVTALNDNYGTRIRLLSDKEIVRVAMGKGLKRGYSASGG